MAKRKTVVSLFHRLFHSRKVIVVSTHGVDYYPLGRLTQVGMILSVLGFISWASYSTGSFMAAQSQINEKDRTIAKVNKENRSISSQFSLLKNDIVKLKQEDGGELSEYAKFVIKQYSDNSLPGLTDGRKLDETNHAMVSERIQFLEGRISQLKEENSEFVDTIRGITGGKINELEKAISQTGLKKDALQKNLSSAGGEAGHLAHLEPAAGVPAKAATIATASGGEGGPYIPYSSEDVANPDQKEAVRDVEHLMDLYAILKLMPLDKPMPSYTITSGFGVRTDPFNGHMARHLGMDFSNPADPRIHATANGEVTFAGFQGAYGNLIELDHGLGITTRYGHLSKILVREGQKIRKGDVIGIEGSTGRSTGAHLHYEVRFNDQPLNPDNFLKAGMRVSQK